MFHRNWFLVLRCRDVGTIIILVSSPMFQFQNRTSIVYSTMPRNFLQAQSNVNKLVPSTTYTRASHTAWKAPDCQWVKLNVDASINFSMKVAVIGGLICDNASLCSAAFTANVGFCSHIFAKIWAIKHGLQWLLSTGLDNVVVENDSRLALQSLQDPQTWQGN